MDCSGEVLDLAPAPISDTRLQEPFVSAAVGSVASVAELHCLMNRSGITVTVAAGDACVAPLRGWEHSISVASFVAALWSASELRAVARLRRAKGSGWLHLTTVAVPLTPLGAGRDAPAVCAAGAGGIVRRRRR